MIPVVVPEEAASIGWLKTTPALPGWLAGQYFLVFVGTDSPLIARAIVVDDDFASHIKGALEREARTARVDATEDVSYRLPYVAEVKAGTPCDECRGTGTVECDRGFERSPRSSRARGRSSRRAVMSERKHSHYFKPTPFADADVYRVLRMFNVTDPCLQHAAKKLLVAGGRGGGKDIGRDIQEAIDTLVRWQEMESEDAAAKGGQP